VTEEELRAELAYWAADGNWYMIWYFTERIKELEEEEMFECLDCGRIFITPDTDTEDQEIGVCPYCGSEHIAGREEK
jgi:DNA-directed RNA polymerase subunit RPC12/RpoP